MAKYCGNIGYCVEEETRPGVIEPIMKERKYYGDILSLKRNTQNGDKINDTLVLNTRISVVSDPFAAQNLNALKYIILNGIRWKISSIDIQFPRMIVETGGEYNGPIPESGSQSTRTKAY